MNGTVQLWQAPLEVGAEEQARLEETLSSAEHEWAGTLRGGLDRRHYVADHGWRRRLLGRLLGCPPTEIAFAVGEHGKPEIVDCRLRFNASRSAGTGVYATSWDSEVGVDVEAIRSDMDLDTPARRLFSESERRCLEALPAHRRPAAGFACWARKEAYGKAVGTGLVFPLSVLEVWAGDDRPTQWGDWAIYTLNAGPGLAGAVAVQADVIAPASVPLMTRVIQTA